MVVFSAILITPDSACLLTGLWSMQVNTLMKMFKKVPRILLDLRLSAPI